MHSMIVIHVYISFMNKFYSDIDVKFFLNPHVPECGTVQ